MSRTPDNSPAGSAAALEERIGHRFRDHEQLRRALTHSSARSASGSDYERLEFLGDRVLGLVIAEMLFTRHPSADQGELSLRLNTLVNAETCAEVADEIGLHEFIVTGSDIKTLTGRKRQSLRADVMESLIAAIYLDGGLDAARRFVTARWDRRARDVVAARRDAKTELQEWAHQVGDATPVYVVDSREGPDHDPVFSVSVSVGGFEKGQGSGRSKREAEQAAAAEILFREGVWQREEMPS